MKVIQDGRPQSGWARELHCTGHGNGGGGCNAYLLVEQADVYDTSVIRFGDLESSNTFRCPLCGCETDLPSYVKLPARVIFPTRVEWLKKNVK
jgi:hypothetical protein